MWLFPSSWQTPTTWFVPTEPRWRHLDTLLGKWKSTDCGWLSEPTQRLFFSSRCFWLPIGSTHGVSSLFSTQLSSLIYVLQNLTNTTMPYLTSAHVPWTTWYIGSLKLLDLSPSDSSLTSEPFLAVPVPSLGGLFSWLWYSLYIFGHTFIKSAFNLHDTSCVSSCFAWLMYTDSTREHPFLQTRIKSLISSTMVTLPESGSTFFVVFWMLCGKQQHTGWWAQCQTTLPNSPIWRDSVCNSLRFGIVN